MLELAQRHLLFFEILDHSVDAVFRVLVICYTQRICSWVENFFTSVHYMKPTMLRQEFKQKQRKVRELYVTVSFLIQAIKHYLLFSTQKGSVTIGTTSKAAVSIDHVSDVISSRSPRVPSGVRMAHMQQG